MRIRDWSSDVCSSDLYDGRAGVRVGGWEAHEVQGERGAVRFGVMLRHVELASFGLDHGTVVGLEVVWGYRDAGDCRRCHEQGDRKKNAEHDVLRCPGAVTLEDELHEFLSISGDLLEYEGQRLGLGKREPES